MRRADGSAVVVDVRADERAEPRDAEAFEVTRMACGQAGRGFERVGVPEETLLANVRWVRTSRSRTVTRSSRSSPRTLPSGLVGSERLAEVEDGGDHPLAWGYFVTIRLVAPMPSPGIRTSIRMVRGHLGSPAK